MDGEAEESDIVEKTLKEMQSDGEEFYQQFTKDSVLRVVTASESWLMSGFRKLREENLT